VPPHGLPKLRGANGGGSRKRASCGGPAIPTLKAVIPLSKRIALFILWPIIAPILLGVMALVMAVGWLLILTPWFKLPKEKAP
jgi:hypothetical protein